MIREVYFYERQYFSIFGYLIALGLGVSGIVLGLPQAGTLAPDTFERGLIGLILIVMSVVVINFLAMTIWVYPNEIKVQFGLFMPYYTRRIPIETVLEWNITQYSPMRESGGWGIRKGTHNNQTATYLTARGSQGIWLNTDTSPIIIGTQFSKNLGEALAKAQSASV
jgi:hypothetical protein